MNKLLLQIAAAAIVVVSFSASAVDVRSAPAPSNSGGGFQTLPKSCPAGKTARIIYDEKGTPVGVVCV